MKTLSRLQIVTAVKAINRRFTPIHKLFEEKCQNYVCEELDIDPKNLNVDELNQMARNIRKMFREKGLSENHCIFDSVKITEYFLPPRFYVKSMIFFTAIKQTDVDDVREVLSYYRQHEDPIEVFRENQRKYQEEMSVNEEKKKADVQKPLISSGFSFMRRR